MSWMQSIKKQLEKRGEVRVDERDPFVKQLIHYLREESNLNYTQTVLDHTVRDVLALDEDLLKFVRTFVMEKQVEAEGLACSPYFTMDEFLSNTGCTPIAAAIYFQMYRKNKAAALKAFLMQDFIEGDEVSEQDGEAAADHVESCRETEESAGS